VFTLILWRQVVVEMNDIKAKSLRPKTRQLTRCPVFGGSSNMPVNMLPTYNTVMKAYLFKRNELKVTPISKEPMFAEVAIPIALQIAGLWLKSSIPIISHQRVVEKLKLYHDKYRNLLKPYKSRKYDQKYISKLEEFAKQSETQLFDIAACKCMEINNCTCAKDRKVPMAERKFLIDQRKTRAMMIGGIDVNMTNSVKRRKARKRKEIERATTAKCLKLSVTHSQPGSFSYFDSDMPNHKKSDMKLSSSTGSFTDMSTVLHNKESDDELITINSRKCKSAQMRSDLPTLARECDRHGISDRCAASLATAVLQDVGVVHDTDLSMVIDRSKVRRERSKVRKRLQCNSVKQLSGLYFDGRKDRTRVQMKNGKKSYLKIISQEHITLVLEPNSQYLGHVTPESGSAKNIHTSINKFLLDNETATKDLVAIGCDGTNVNTGVTGGIIRLLEIQLGRPLHWFICMLHANELPLRHLIQRLDGGTQGPTLFSGNIGKALGNCESLPLVHYNAIEFENCPDMEGIELSTDQQYLYNICKAVSYGICSPDLAFQKPGPVCHSRWLTTANRILRLYIATECPSENLTTLATFIMKVYAPVWFHIKTKSACTEGSKHLWRMIKYSRYLPQNLRDIVDEVIQRNGYFGHAENILLAMLTDERSHIRELAYRRILAARVENELSTKIRQFRVPLLNFNSEDYTDLVEWQTIDRYEPPLMKHIPDKDIANYVKSNSVAEAHKIALFPCHTQATERCIRLVTEASAKVSGQTARDGFIRAGIASRQIMKTFNTKSEFHLY